MCHLGWGNTLIGSAICFTLPKVTKASKANVTGIDIFTKNFPKYTNCFILDKFIHEISQTSDSGFVCLGYCGCSDTIDQHVLETNTGKQQSKGDTDV
jgi:hypothetical protein